MLEAGDVACAMEVSSHALELHRCDAVHWAAAVFTNLTQDHLDFHPTMEAYFLAKRRLWEAGPPVAVANVDDPYGAPPGRRVRRHRDVRRSTPRPTTAPSGCRPGSTGPPSRVTTPDGAALELQSPLPGRFNVANVLGAVATVRALGVPDETIVAAVADAGRVPGRFEPVDEGQDFAVLVDYAHTPDSLENVLAAARGLTDGRVIAVFGCGGDRDRGKRPLMGEIGSRLADLVVVTSDNPRSEDPEAIIDEVIAGAGPRAERIPDRREAIRRAVEAGRAGDVVVIAGKGHEQGQEFAGGRKLPFDDVTVAREMLREHAAEGAPR